MVKWFDIQSFETKKNHIYNEKIHENNGYSKN